MSYNSDSWKTWTSSYGQRCLDNEESLQDILLETNKNKSGNCKKYIIFGICVLGIIIVGIICLVFVL
jgi:hypothetical protein